MNIVEQWHEWLPVGVAVSSIRAKTNRIVATFCGVDKMSGFFIKAFVVIYLLFFCNLSFAYTYFRLWHRIGDTEAYLSPEACLQADMVYLLKKIEYYEKYNRPGYLDGPYYSYTDCAHHQHFSSTLPEDLSGNYEPTCSSLDPSSPDPGRAVFYDIEYLAFNDDIDYEDGVGSPTGYSAECASSRVIECPDGLTPMPLWLGTYRGGCYPPSPAVCPANSTANGDGTCSCNAGYVQSGDSCVPRQCDADLNDICETPNPQSTIVSPPQEKLGTYVTSSGPGLKTACLFRSGGPLVVQVPVPAVVNPAEIGPDGYLKDPAKLIANKVIGATATILFPAFDVDNNTTPEPERAPERDIVTFNGKTYGAGVLSGSNNQWVTQPPLQIPIGELKFGVNNELRIDIDVDNTTDIWCTALDWVSVQFDVAAPYVLAHGINASASTWNEGASPGVISTLNDIGVAWNRFSVAANGLVDQNAISLANQIDGWLKTMKADRVHIIAHSKGGLDAQAIPVTKPQFQILSLSTLSTPHRGSVVADVAIMVAQTTQERINDADPNPDPNGYVQSLLTESALVYLFGPGLPGLKDLTTYVAAQRATRSPRERGIIQPTFSIGASADLNNDERLNGSEANGMSFFSGPFAASLFNPSYQVGRNFSSVTYTEENSYKPASGDQDITTSRKALQLTINPAPVLHENDIVVTEDSANPDYTTPVGNAKANHTTVKTGDNVRKLIEKTISLGREQ